MEQDWANNSSLNRDSLASRLALGSPLRSPLPVCVFMWQPRGGRHHTRHDSMCINKAVSVWTLTYQWGRSRESLVCPKGVVCFCPGPQLGWAASHSGDSPWSGDKTKRQAGEFKMTVMCFSGAVYEHGFSRDDIAFYISVQDQVLFTFCICFWFRNKISATCVNFNNSKVSQMLHNTETRKTDTEHVAHSVCTVWQDAQLL